MSPLTELSATRCFGGLVKKFQHTSKLLGCDMKFTVFLPQGTSSKKVPVLYWLSGLTCNEDNFITKAGAQRAAEEHGIALICPDTSPRGLNLPGEDDAYDFGSGAGFYVNATEEPWSTNYKMYSYITDELPELVNASLPVDSERQSIFGHSMGGHGALILALKNPGRFKSVSAFAPICNPLGCPWGEKAFKGYLGSVEAGAEYDASVLAKAYDGPALDVLVDQGGADNFLTQKQLLPETLQASCSENGKLNLEYNEREGYDHSYYFISSFVDNHIAFHAKHLQ